MYGIYETLHLRPVNEGDDAFLDDLYFSRRTDLQQISADAQFVRQLINMQHRTQLLGIRNTYPQARHLLIEQGGQRIGRLVIDIGKADVRIIDLALLPEAQGQGTGKAILGAMQHDAAEKNQGISLAVEKTNSAACALYLKMGFQVYSDDAVFEHMHWHSQWKDGAGKPAGHEHVAA